ncbi:hypothetical protein [Promicromonospora aerolata]|uniref:Uncharacterized protein n=1 Tax=Promicromonospora aerolata TaxID=195749 RepID=A0ABW4V8L2_9MICO
MTVVTVSSKTGPGADVDTATTADTRHARALAALRSAEVRTGVRKQVVSARTVQAVQAVQADELGEQAVRELSTVRPHEQPAARPAPSSGGRVGSPGPDEGARVLPVDPRLASLLPDGGLRTGTTVVVQGSTSLLLTLLAEASRDGAWTVLVGYPAAGMAAAADAGCDLARTLVVPLPAGSGVDAPAVLAALIDGMDVVVVGPEVALLDQDRRRLTARARERGTVLVSALPVSSGEGSGREWSGAHVVLEATAGDWAGIDHGAGWLRRRTLRVRRTGRGSAARPLHLDVEVPVLSGGQGSGTGGTRSPGERSESRPRLELVG